MEILACEVCEHFKVYPLYEIRMCEIDRPNCEMEVIKGKEKLNYCYDFVVKDNRNILWN